METKFFSHPSHILFNFHLYYYFTATYLGPSLNAVINQDDLTTGVPNTNKHSVEGSNPMWLQAYENEWFKEGEEFRFVALILIYFFGISSLILRTLSF